MRPSWGRSALAGGVWAVGVLAHDPVTQGVAGLAERWGIDRLGAAIGAVALAAGLGTAVAGWLLGFRRHGVRADVVWLVIVTATAVAWGTLTQTRAEVVHLGQYAVVGVLWWRAGLRATPALALAVGLGAVDEGVQALWLYRDRGFDWNDVVLNTVGGMIGLGCQWSWRGWGRSSFLVPGLDGVLFHPLTPGEGLATVALLVGLFHVVVGHTDRVDSAA